MFFDRRNDGLNISEDLRTLEGWEGSRDFHVQLHHARVPFGLIGGEGNCEVCKEPQDVITLVRKRTSMLWPGRLAFRPRVPRCLGV